MHRTKSGTARRWVMSVMIRGDEEGRYARRDDGGTSLSILLAYITFSDWLLIRAREIILIGSKTNSEWSNEESSSLVYCRFFLSALNGVNVAEERVVFFNKRKVLDLSQSPNITDKNDIYLGTETVKISWTNTGIYWFDIVVKYSNLNR